MSENQTSTSPEPQQQQQDSNAQQVQGETNDTTTTGPTTRVVLADRYKTKICEKFQEKGKCPYDRKCMFAHGEHELRTYEMNIMDGLTTEENIRQFRRMQRADFQRFLARQEKMQFEKLHGGNGNGSGNSEGFIPPAQYYQGAPPPAPLPHPTGGNASRSVRSSTPTGPGKNNSSRNSEIGSRPGTSEVHSRASSEHGADSSPAIQQQSHPQQQNHQQQYHQQQAPQNTHQWVQQQQQQSQQQQQQYHPSASSQQQQQHAQQYQPQNQQQQSYYNGAQQQQYANYQQYNNPAQQQQQYNQQQGYPQQQHQYERYQQQYYQQNQQQQQQFQQQQQSYNQYYQQQQAANYQWQQPQQQQYNQQQQQFNNASYVAERQQGGGNQQQHEQQQRPTNQHQPHEYQQPNGASARVATPVRSNSDAGDFEESQLDGSSRPGHARRGSRGSSTGSGYRFDPYESAAVDQQYLRHQRPGSAQE